MGGGRGTLDRRIARRLFVSPRTVQAHLTHIYNKLDVTVRNRILQRAE